jgi:hypothetical protein
MDRRVSSWGPALAGPRTIKLLALVAASGPLLAQAASISVTSGALHVKVPSLRFIKGEPLERLKDGRSVRFDIDLLVLAKPAAAAVAQSRHGFVLSYDLWEERFAVTHVGPPSRAISHLTPSDAEAWCLDRLTVPVSALGQLGRDAPFWIRVEYRAQEGDRAADATDTGFTLRGLIDRLSRRRQSDDLTGRTEAGPFYITKN